MDDTASFSWNRLFLPVFLFLAILLAVGIYLLIKKTIPMPQKPHSNKNTSIVKRVTTAPTQAPRAYMAISQKDKSETVTLSRELKLVLGADTKGQEIVGYDAVVQYDPEYVSYIGFDNPLSSTYKVRVQKRDNSLMITASLDKPDTAPMPLDDTELVYLRFKVLKAGRSDISLQFAKGMKSDSNLMNSVSEDILDEVRSLSLTMGEEMTLNTGQVKSLPDSSYKVKLISVSVPTDACRDCISKADLQLQGADDGVYAFSFTSGGFAGNLVNEARLKGFLISLSDLKQNSATILIVPE